MIRFLADENFNRHFIRALEMRAPHVDILLAQQVGLGGRDDDVLLAWAAENGRVLLSHDYKTVPLHARRRIQHGRAMSGVLLMRRSLPVRFVVDELVLRAECTDLEDWDGQIDYLHL